MSRKRYLETSGTTLMETLVVLAIIMVILTFQVPALTKALRMAKGVAAGEAMHQNDISSMATSSESNFQPKRAEARRAFRQVVDAGKFEATVTQMVYVVRNDDEFRAYWHTLLNPKNTEKLPLSLEVRREINLPDVLENIGLAAVGLSPKFTYDPIQDDYGVLVPLTFAMNSDKSLIGGIKAGWHSEQHDFVAGLFIGSAFSVF